MWKLPYGERKKDSEKSGQGRNTINYMRVDKTRQGNATKNGNVPERDPQEGVHSADSQGDRHPPMHVASVDGAS